jgi:uncharacterized protein
MMRPYKSYFIASVTLLLLLAAQFRSGIQVRKPDLYPASKLQEVDFVDVAIDDSFWYPRIRLVQEVTLHHLLDIAEAEGKIANFRIVAGMQEGKISLHNAGDSDIYKLIESAAYSLGTHWDSVLVMRLDTLIEWISGSQQADGYLNTQFTFPDDHPFSPDLNVLHARRFGYGLKDRWNSTLTRWPYAYSQLYCSGHLMEAAVVYYQATGKRRLLDAATRNADHIRQVFTEDRIKEYADHPQVEIGLLKLYEITADRQYLELAGSFCRFVKFARPRDIVPAESYKPLFEQREAWSHCVRTGYIYTAATGVIRATVAPDLSEAIHSIWDNLNCCKLYVHGGVGNGTPFEQHGHNHDLPVLNTYSESCAQIAQCQWNHQLNLLHGTSGYADIIEWEAYNGALAGFGLDGKNFLYSNKLNMDTLDRKDYHSGVRTSYLFCCPSKIPGFITGINRWTYAKNEAEKTLYVNQFIGSRLKTALGSDTLRLIQKSGFPWKGEVILEMETDHDHPVVLKIRMPGWLLGNKPLQASPYYFKDATDPGLILRLNGQSLEPAKMIAGDGYLTIERRFRKGDQILLSFEMPVRRIYTDPVVKANTGRVALSRGPVLFSLEGADNAFDVLKMVLPPDADISSVFRNDLLHGVQVLSGSGISAGKLVDFMAIPYFSWQNRGIFQLATLLTEDPEKVETEERNREKMNTDG